MKKYFFFRFFAGTFGIDEENDGLRTICLEGKSLIFRTGEKKSRRFPRTANFRFLEGFVVAVARIIPAEPWGKITRFPLEQVIELKPFQQFRPDFRAGVKFLNKTGHARKRIKGSTGEIEVSVGEKHARVIL